MSNTCDKVKKNGKIGSIILDLNLKVVTECLTQRLTDFFFISEETKLAKPVIKLNNMFKAEKEDDGSTIEKLKYFSGYTTAHGFGRLVESKSYVRKVFWVMACFGAFTMFSCQVVWLAQDYISKPVETYITLKHVKVRSLI